MRFAAALPENFGNLPAVRTNREFILPAPLLHALPKSFVHRPALLYLLLMRHPLPESFMMMMMMMMMIY